MLEATVFLTLLGVGLLASQEKKKQKNVVDTFANNDDNPSQEDPHKSVYSDRTREMEYEACSKAINDSQNPRVTGVVSKNARQGDFVNNQSGMNESITSRNFIGKEKKSKIDSSKTTYSRLTGSKIENFSHNNMVPFFGSRIRQNLSDNSNATILEKYTGVGEVDDMFYLQKKEVPNMFKPEKDIGLPCLLYTSDAADEG